MKISLFIKSYAHDFDWLCHTRDSVRKFSNGIFDEVVLLLPEGDVFEWPDATIHHVKDLSPGYLGQQIWKCYADQFCTGDLIIFGDSDTIFTRPLNKEDFIKGGKPIWQYTPFGNARDDQSIWKGPMREFIGKEPENETMRRHCFSWPREFFDRLRSFCKFKHRKELVDYVMARGNPDRPLDLVWSEFNCAGAFAWEHEREMFSWVRDEDALPAYVFQSHTHGPNKEKYLAEFRAKATEILGTPSGDGVNATQGEPAGSTLLVHETHPLTIPGAIEFLASSVKDNFHKARIIRDLKRAWKGRGEAPKRSKALSAPRNGKDTLLLCIHSYPGANETVERHWDGFVKSGATRIVGIGTTDHLCRFPGESVEIGKNAYLKTKGKDAHLCQRLLDTVEWCLTQPEDRFLIAEYDVLFLRKMPKFHGVCAFLTGGKVNGSKTSQFFHGPWGFCRESGALLVQALREALPDSQEYPDNSPDLFFGLACERAGIPVTCPWKMFTRNSLDRNGDLDLAVQAALDGVHCIHGVKQEWEFNSIMAAMNEKEVSLSHVA